ncbi:hypothetical protein SCAR479_11434 [Seiridium cardinale]|uniref:Uncharacterized protein n=1 Tax=Seiridium cardinale TaxID=138064 RepID=A0ABR2XDS1_9PEZI
MIMSRSVPIASAWFKDMSLLCSEIVANLVDADNRLIGMIEHVINICAGVARWGHLQSLAQFSHNGENSNYVLVSGDRDDSTRAYEDARNSDDDFKTPHI